MIRFLLRFLGVLCLAGAFFFVIHDGTKSIADQRWYVTRIRDLSAMIGDGRAAHAPPTLDQLAPWLWDPAMQAPTWLVLIVLGIVLVVIGRKKKPLIGYTR
jgi:hypothetical protein